MKNKKTLRNRVKNFKKKFFKNLNNLNLKDSLYYYNLFFKNIDIITNKSILKKKKSSNIKKNISKIYKNKLFFEFIQ